MDSVRHSAGDDKEPEKRKRKFFAWFVIAGLIILAILAAIGTCGQQGKAHKAGTATRTPHDVSDFSVVFVNGEAILYWVDSDDAFLDHMEISWEPDGANPIKVDKGTGKYILPGLEEGKEYSFSVKAVDKWGNISSNRRGGSGKVHKLRKPAQEPDTHIMSIKGTPVSGQATLSWTNLNPGEYEYIEIFYDPDHLGEPVRIPKGVESKTLMSLANGVEHTFYAVAVDARGSRKSLKELGLFISDHATSAESIVGWPTVGEFTLVWDDPPDPGLDRLEVSYSPGGETLVPVSKGTQNKSFSNLNNGSRYEFSIYAVDDDGHRRPVTGAHLYPVNTDFHDDDLDAMVSGKPVGGRLRLDWADPDLQGFDHVEIVANPFGDDAKSTSVPRGVQANAFAGLSDSEEYSFLVYGIGKDGARHVIRGVQLSTPQPALSEDEISAIVRGYPVTGKIRLDWKNPAFADFDHVEIITNPDGQGKVPKTTVVESGQSYSFSSLSDSEEYSFLAYGVGANGEKRPISSVKLTTPEKPRIIARPVMGQVTLVWDDPRDPGLELVELDYSPRGEMPVMINKGNGTFTFTGLADREYEFHVTAVTSEGNAYAMGAEVVVPEIHTGVPVNGELTLEWAEPANIKADHIEIVYSPGGERVRRIDGGAGSQNFSGLRDGQEYSFAVFAVDGGGRRVPVKQVKIHAPETAVVQEEIEEPLVIKYLNPLEWSPVGDTTFGDSTIFALSFGYSADRVPRWVAGGDDGKMAYSSDYGITWKEVPDSHFGSFAINSICYVNHRWIAGGKNGKMAWSTDAIAWNEVRDTYFAEMSVNVNVVVYGDGRWAAGGSGGSIMFSGDDGLTWQLATGSAFGPSSSDVSALAFYDGRWVAGSTTGNIAWSDNGGAAWNVVDDSPFSKYAINIIVHDKGSWLAAGYAQRIAASDDGKAWRPMPRPFYIIALGYNGFRWVAGGQEGRVAWTGDSASTWVTDSLGRSFFGDSWVEAVAFGRIPGSKGRWLIGGQNGKLIFADEKDEEVE